MVGLLWVAGSLYTNAAVLLSFQAACYEASLESKSESGDVQLSVCIQFFFCGTLSIRQAACIPRVESMYEGALDMIESIRCSSIPHEQTLFKGCGRCR